ncbi:MAG: hypothetical protein V1879_02430, partial [Pseudomonadota bacterium]
MEVQVRKTRMLHRMVRMLLMILCVCSAVMAHAQGNVSPLPATTRGSFEFSAVMYYVPPNQPWYPTLQSACEAQAVYLSGLRKEWAGAYCHKTFLVPANVNGYWYASIAFPNWHIWSGELAVTTEVARARPICPSGYGTGTTTWDNTTTPRTMVVNCSRANACPANSTGVPVNYPTTCTCNEGYAPDSTGTSCVNENLTITLTGGTTIEPGKDLSLTVTVINKNDNQPPKNPVPVKISLKVDPKSGGHDHGDGTRPRGGINNEDCKTDDTCKTLSIGREGSATITFKAPAAAGTHTVTATCDKCSNGPQEVKVDVRVKESEA